MALCLASRRKMAVTTTPEMLPAAPQCTPGAARTPLAPRNDAPPSSTRKASATAQTPLPRAPHETPRLPARTPLPPPPPPEVECQCCYDTVPVTQTVTCAARAAHTVCEGCVRHLVQARIGEGSAKPLTCLAGGAGCKAPLPHKAVAQALASPVRRQRDAIVARAELMRANIEGLQSCPFCPYSCVKPALFTDAPEVFQCEHPTCGKRSCTRCKGEILPNKPHACPESEETDALTDAVIRDCPRCATRFYKDAGCNKMRCPTCAAESCYVCRKLITDKVPYLHFCFCDCNVSRRGHITRRGATARERCRLCGKCSLWHADAAQPALEDTRKRSCACAVS